MNDAKGLEKRINIHCLLSGVTFVCINAISRLQIISYVKFRLFKIRTNINKY